MIIRLDETHRTDTSDYCYSTALVKSKHTIFYQLNYRNWIITGGLHVDPTLTVWHFDQL